MWFLKGRGSMVAYFYLRQQSKALAKFLNLTNQFSRLIFDSMARSQLPVQVSEKAFNKIRVSFCYAGADAR